MLKQSILNYDSIDSIQLAKEMTNSNNQELKKISSIIFRKNKKFKESIEISLENEEYEDAIVTAQQSNKESLVNNLLNVLAKKNLKHFYSLALLRCYDCIQIEIVMELMWKYDLYKFSMPFII